MRRGRCGRAVGGRRSPQRGWPAPLYPGRRRSRRRVRHHRLRRRSLGARRGPAPPRPCVSTTADGPGRQLGGDAGVVRHRRELVRWCEHQRTPLSRDLDRVEVVGRRRRLRLDDLAACSRPYTEAGSTSGSLASPSLNSSDTGTAPNPAALASMPALAVESVITATLGIARHYPRRPSPSTGGVRSPARRPLLTARSLALARSHRCWSFHDGPCCCTGVMGLSVSELSARTGVPVSAITYRRLGLLPPTVVDRRRLRYGDDHVRALRLIRRLREQRGLPLNRIAAILPTLLASEQERSARRCGTVSSTPGEPGPDAGCAARRRRRRVQCPLVRRGDGRRPGRRQRHRQAHVLPLLRLQGGCVHRRRPAAAERVVAMIDGVRGADLRAALRAPGSGVADAARVGDQGVS